MRPADTCGVLDALPWQREAQTLRDSAGGGGSGPNKALTQNITGNARRLSAVLLKACGITTQSDWSTHRLSLALELLEVASELSHDVGGEVLRDDLMLAGVVVQLIEGGHKGSTGRVPGQTQEVMSAVKWTTTLVIHVTIDLLGEYLNK